jgi:2-polyprenyl-3-methyl-5-hydroxy-6-metoxy-1,4-benzoquinol methylase
MPSFQQRSNKKELLDRDDLLFADIRRNMQELDVINHRLGGHGITLAGMEALTKNITPVEILHIVETGCGGGDNLRVIGQWAKKKNLKVRLTGIDLNAECIDYARSQPDNSNIHFIHSDYSKVVFDEKPGIIFSSLFCHHFTNEQLHFMLGWMKDQSTKGFFINDLHRHPLAYYSIKILTRLFSKSYLVRNDAPLSVLRGFTRKDWEQLLNDASIPASCSWQWAFRWLIVYAHATEQTL